MKEETKPTMKRPYNRTKPHIPHKPAPTYLPDYVVTQSDLRQLRTEFQKDLMSGLNDLRLEMSKMHVSLVSTMATKTELRLIGLIITIGISILGALIAWKG